MKPTEKQKGIFQKFWSFVLRDWIERGPESESAKLVAGLEEKLAEFAEADEANALACKNLSSPWELMGPEGQD